MGISRFKSGLAIFTLRFWLRQKARWKIWRVTGHHFLWSRKRHEADAADLARDDR